jgi:hypothetical protein
MHTKQKHYTTDPHKQRERKPMDRFSCGGMLSVTITDTFRSEFRLQLQHEQHLKYTNITPSPEIKAQVRDMGHLPPIMVRH